MKPSGSFRSVSGEDFEIVCKSNQYPSLEVSVVFPGFREGKVAPLAIYPLIQLI